MLNNYTTVDFTHVNHMTSADKWKNNGPVEALNLS